MLCFRKFLIKKKFMDNREGEDQKLPWKVFCLIVPEHFLEEPFPVGFQKNSVSENLIDKRRGEVSRFSLEIFCLTVPKHFVEKPFCVGFQKIYDSKKVYG